MNIVPARSQLSNQLSNVSSKKRYVCSYFSLIGFGVPSFFTIEIRGCTWVKGKEKGEGVPKIWLVHEPIQYLYQIIYISIRFQ